MDSEETLAHAASKTPSSVLLSQDELFKELQIRHVAQMQVPANIKVKGYLIMASAIAAAVAFFYCAFLSKLLPPTGWRLLDVIREDHYFCYLLPLLILPTSFVIYLNWLAMSHFQQNG